MKKIALALACLISFGCTDHSNKPRGGKHVDEMLINLSQKYCGWSKPQYELKGYVHSKCDGSGFTSLYSLMCDDIDLSVFEDNGKLYRSPSHDCYIKGRGSNGSKSESSRDMYLMRLIAAFEQKDVGYLERVVDYGKEHTWMMCKGEGIDGISRCFITPSLRQLHYDALKKLNGENLSKADIMEETHIDLPLLDGFQAHLEVIKIWLTGRIYGGISDRQLSRLGRYADREDRNALFHAVRSIFTGSSFDTVIPLLDFFPRDELPSTKQHCTEYIWQRDQDSDSWKPCDPIQYHSGTDFNFVIYVMSH